MTLSTRSLAGVLAAAILAVWASSPAAHQQPGKPRLAVDLSAQGWAELRDARPGLPFAKVEYFVGLQAENAWPNKVVLHSLFLRRGEVARRAQRGIELREATGFTRVVSLPLGDLVPDDLNVARGHVVPAARFLACATGEHLRVDPSLFAGVDLRRADALFVSVEPADPKAREGATARPLLIYLPALDGSSK